MQQAQIKNHVALGLLVGSNLVVSIASQFVILKLLGPGNQTDAFIAASTIPQILTGLIGIALTNVLIPLFAGEGYRQQQDDAWRTIYVVGFIFCAISIFLAIFAEVWVPLLFPGFDADKQALCVLLSRIQILSIPFAAVNLVANAVHYSRGRFLFSECCTLVPAVLSFVLILEFVPVFGIVTASWLVLIRSSLQMFPQMKALGSPVPWIGVTDAMRETWRRAKPLLVGNIYYRSDVLVDRYLLSSGSAGDISIFGLVQQTYASLNTIISKVIGSTSIPRLTIFAKEKNETGFIEFYRWRLLLLFGLSFAGYVALLWFGVPALIWFFGDGRINASQAELLWNIFKWLGALLLIGCPGVVLSGAYYAMGNTIIPSMIGILSFTAFVIIRIVSFEHYGIAGLCLAISAYYIFNAIMLVASLPLARRSYF